MAAPAALVVQLGAAFLLLPSASSALRVDLVGPPPITGPRAGGWLEEVGYPSPEMVVRQEDLRLHMGAVDAAALALEARGRAPLVLHIGACGLGSRMDNAIHKPLRNLSFTRQPSSSQWRVVAVEPQLRLVPGIQDLASNVIHYSKEEFDIITGVVEGKCPETTNFISMNRKKLWEDFLGACEKTGVDSFGATSWEDALREVELWPRVPANRPPVESQACNDGFQAFKSYVDDYVAEDPARLRRGENHWGAKELASSKLGAYFEVRPLLCHTPASLLEALGFEASQLVMLVVDAEGADQGIVEAFLQLEGFAPPFLQFEGTWSNRPPHLPPLIEALRTRGYRVGVGMEQDEPPAEAQDRNILALLNAQQ